MSPRFKHGGGRKLEGKLCDGTHDGGHETSGFKRRPKVLEKEQEGSVATDCGQMLGMRTWVLVVTISAISSR